MNRRKYATVYKLFIAKHLHYWPMPRITPIDNDRSAFLESMLMEKNAIIAALESENVKLHYEIHRLEIEQKCKLNEAKSLEIRLRQYTRFADTQLEACQERCEYINQDMEMLNHAIDSLVVQMDAFITTQSKVVSQLERRSTDFATAKHHMIEFTTRLRENLTCPISFDLMDDPVTLSSGMTYGNASLRSYWQGNNIGMCPTTRLEQFIEPQRTMVVVHVVEELLGFEALLKSK